MGVTDAAVGGTGTVQYRQGFARHPAADCAGTVTPRGRGRHAQEARPSRTHMS